MPLLPLAEEIQPPPTAQNHQEIELEKAIIVLHTTQDKEGTSNQVTDQGELPEQTPGQQQLLNHRKYKPVWLGPGSLAPTVDHRGKGMVRLV